MSVQFLSTEWAEALKAHLNGNDAFKQAAQGQNATIQQVITGGDGETLYWIGPAGDAREAGPGTDFHATSNGEISITPLHVDLTDHASLPAWRDWANGAD